MSVIKPSVPGGWSIFCDDIRIENNGKQIYIGVYDNEMLIAPSFPIVLPTFAVLARLTSRLSESAQSFRLCIFAPGLEQPVQEVFIQPEGPVRLPPGWEDPDADPDPVIAFQLLHQFRDFRIAEPGRIRVRAYRGEDEIHLGSLPVRLNPKAVPAATKPQPEPEVKPEPMPEPEAQPKPTPRRRPGARKIKLRDPKK